MDEGGRWAVSGRLFFPVRATLWAQYVATKLWRGRQLVKESTADRRNWDRRGIVAATVTRRGMLP